MRSWLLIVTALAVLASLSACEPRTDNPQRHIYCTVTGDPPERDSDDAPRRIIAQVRYWCDKPGADSLTLTLRLQRRDARGVWRDVSRSTFTVRRGQTVRTDTQRYRVRQVAAACALGDYRTVVQGRSVARGRTKTYSQTGVESHDPCTTFLH